MPFSLFARSLGNKFSQLCALFLLLFGGKGFSQAHQNGDSGLPLNAFFLVEGKSYFLHTSDSDYVVQLDPKVIRKDLVRVWNWKALYQPIGSDQNEVSIPNGLPWVFKGKIKDVPRGFSGQSLSEICLQLTRIPGVLFARPMLLDPASGVSQALTQEIIVSQKPGVSLEKLKAALSGIGVGPEALRSTLMDRTWIVNLPLAKDPLLTSRQISEMPEVLYAEPNFIKLLKPHTNDPLYPLQWSLNNLGNASYPGATPDADLDVPEAWAITRGSPNVKVAVLDEGVDMNHPDLVGNMLNGFDAASINSNGQCNSTDPHGTACAGIIAGTDSNGIGVSGIAPNCRILPVRIAYRTGAGGGWVTNDVWIGNALTWAYQNGADILSNSWAGGSVSTTINSAITNATNLGRQGKGSLVIFSAGNSGLSSAAYPSSQEDAVSVAAMSMCDQVKSTSSCDQETFWGSNYGTGTDVGAPGVKIQTTDIVGSGGYNSTDYAPEFNGTSAACPHVAAVAAMIFSVNPNLTSDEARVFLETSCDKTGGYTYSTVSAQPNGTWSTQLGYGRVNALKAVQLAFSGVLASFSANPRFGIAIPQTVQFQNFSVGATSYQWSFPGGTPSTSTTSNPSVQYSAYGDFDVQLIAIASNGTRDTLREVGFISLKPGQNMFNGTISTCNSYICDNGGPNGNYTASGTQTMTIQPDTAGRKVDLEFFNFSTENSSDILYIYNGPTVGSPLLGSFSGSFLPPRLISTHPSGSLTLRFVSNGSIQLSGWLAKATCYKPVPPVITSFSPDTARIGKTISVLGSGFFGIDSLLLGNKRITDFTVETLEKLKFVVPTGGQTNKIRLFTAFGLAQSLTDLVIDTAGFDYCIPPHPSCDNSDGYISKVVVLNTTLNNSTLCSDDDGPAYNIFPSSGSTSGQLALGRTYRIQVSSPGISVGVWLDWNRNGSFDVGEFKQATNTSGTFEVSYTVPASASPGLTGLRIRSRSGSISSDACEEYFSGETEDYYVRLVFDTQPLIQSFQPNFGLPGTSVVIQGKNLQNLSQVAFNGASASFTTQSSQQVTAVVPVAASTGRISVLGSNGKDTSQANFFVSATAPLRILVVGTSSDSLYAMDAVSKIASFSDFGETHHYNADNKTPSVEFLKQYAAVLLMPNIGYLNSIRLGDSLAKYAQTGGGVVNCMFGVAGSSTNTRLSGSFLPYELIPFGSSNSFQSMTLGTRHLPQHPLLRDVNTFVGGSGSYAPVTTTIQPGAIRVADWSGGAPLIVVREFNLQKKFRKVDLGFFPASTSVLSGGWSVSSDGAKILRNALLWACKGDTLPWISSFSPLHGLPGAQVLVRGSNLLNASVVRFNGLAATQVLSVTDSAILVVVPPNATTGKIQVTTPRGTATSSANFIVGNDIPLFTGTIYTCEATLADDGGSGGNYTASQNKTLVVFPETSGKLVRLSFSKFRTQATSDRLNVYNGPNTFSPLAGSFSGTSLPATITASNSSGALTLAFISNSTIQDSGFVARVQCVPVQTPVITGFSPGSGVVGSLIKVYGQHFIQPLTVSFNGTPATTVQYPHPDTLLVRVPVNATTGKISVSNGFGLGLSAQNFVVRDGNIFCLPLHPGCPTSEYISKVQLLNTSLNNTTGCSNQNGLGYSIYPASGNTTANLVQGRPYSLVVGTSSDLIVSAWLDANRDSIFQPTEYTLITNNSAGGQVTVTLNIPPAIPTGTALLRIRSRASGSPNGPGDACTEFFSGETEDYTLIIQPDTNPAIQSLQPAKGPVGTQVTIRGRKMQNTTQVAFNGLAASFVQLNDSTLTAIVPPNAATGSVTVVCAAGTLVSPVPFVVKFPGLLNVLLLHSESTLADPVALKDYLDGLGLFDSVGIFNGRLGTPNLTQLQDVDVVLVWNSASWFSRENIGNVLAQYIQGGGRVVSAIYATAGVSGSNPGGAYSPYELISFGSSTHSANPTLGTRFFPNHPILKSISTVSVEPNGPRPSGQSVQSGSRRIADWVGGYPLVVVKDSIGSANARKVDLGIYPVPGTNNTYGWAGTSDAGTLIRNALFWAAGEDSLLAVLPVITSFSPESGSPGTQVTVKGQNLSNAQSVRFNGSIANFTANTDTSLVATVPVGTTTGKISLIKANRIVYSPNVFFIGDTLRMGQANQVTRCNFYVASSHFGRPSGGYNTGEAYTLVIYPSQPLSKVRIQFPVFNTSSNQDYLRIYNGPSTSNNLLASLTGLLNAPSVISTHSSGALTLVFSSISSGGGLPGFLGLVTCIAPGAPVVTSFSPLIGNAGTVVNISGIGLNGISQVRFNGVSASFTPGSSTFFQAIVPAGATTGKIEVVNAVGSGLSSANFVVCSQFTSPPTISDTVFRCGTGSITLTATGAPSGSGYRWFSTPTSTSVLSSLASYSFTLSTPRTVYVEFYESSSGCFSTRKPVVAMPIIALPATFSGLPASHCLNGPPSTLVPLHPGGTFTNATGNLFYPNVVGTQTVTYTLVTKGCSTTFNRQTIVRGLPDPGFSGLLPSYCKGDPASVLVPVNSGGQFFGGLVTGNQFNPTDTGNFQVSYTVSLLGCADTLTRLTRVNSIPQAELTLQNDTLMVQNAPPGTVISWLFNGQPIPGQNGTLLDVETTGSYQVVLSQNNCSDTSALQFVTSLGRSVKLLDISVYPQPFSEEVSIFWQSPRAPIRNFEFCDALGRKVSPEMLSHDDTRIRFSFKGLPPGLYMVRWLDLNGMQALPLMKK